jgi:mannosyltransferase
LIAILRPHEVHRHRGTLAVTPPADALIVGVCAFLISVAGAERPSFWADEAATISASTRTLAQLRELLASVDAVHGLYYVLMHGWFAVFPATEFWSRVPSAVMVGVAGAGVVVLGRQLSTRSVAVTAGVVFAVLPRTTWAGIEARSGAMAIAAAVWVTVLCVAATRRDEPRWWAGYALALVGATLVSPFLVLLVVTHWLLASRLAGCRRTVTAWWVATVSAGAAVAPFLGFVRTQRLQVDWILPVGPDTVVQVIGDQNFAPVFASRHRVSDPARHDQITPDMLHAMLYAWALVLPLVVVLALVVSSAIRRRHTAASVVGPDARLTVMAAATWILVPTAVLVAYSATGEPLYQPRYLAFTTPAVALLVGLAVVAVARTPQAIAFVTAAVMLAAMPNYLAQRLPYAKQGNDYSQVADLVKSRAAAADCLHADDAVNDMVGRMKAARPDAFATLRDYGEIRSAVDGATLRGVRRDVATWAGRLVTCPTVWTIAPAGVALTAVSGYSVLRDNGFRVLHRWQFNLTDVIESRRPR